MIETKDTYSNSHRQAFENPEEPLMAEGICISPSSELNDTKDATNLPS